jgi:hypothetical protein
MSVAFSAWRDILSLVLPGTVTLETYGEWDWHDTIGYMSDHRTRTFTMAVCLILAALPLSAQSRIEAKGQWSDDAHKTRLASVVVNCYRAAKTCTVVSTVGDDLMSNDHEIVRWDSGKIVAIGGGDCVTNTLVVNLSRKTVSISSASNHEHSGDGVCQEMDRHHPEWIQPATLIQPPGGWFLVY